VDRKNQEEDRRSFRGDFQAMTMRLLDNAPSYDARARMDDGLCVNETSKVAAVQPGAASLLHAKWQEEGPLDHLSREECSALARAGYRVQRDEDGYWTWWREKRLSHLWMHANESGWMVSSSSSIAGAKWKLAASFSHPTIPYFDGYHITVQDLLREGLTTSIMVIRDYVPERVINEQFFGVLRDICDEAIQNMELESDWVNQILFTGTLARVVGKS